MEDVQHVKCDSLLLGPKLNQVVLTLMKVENVEAVPTQCSGRGTEVLLGE